jgi:hypothetical protein
MSPSGGTVFIIAPLRDALPADRGRELSTLEELQEAFTNADTPDTHSWQAQGRRGHYWVLTPDVLIELARRVNPYWKLVAHESVDSKVGNGFTLVFRVGKPAWERRPITVMDDALSEYIVTTPNGSYVPGGLAQGVYVPNAYILEAGFFVPRRNESVLPRVDAEQLEQDTLAAIDDIQAALEEERSENPKLQWTG